MVKAIAYNGLWHVAGRAQEGLAKAVLEIHLDVFVILFHFGERVIHATKIEFPIAHKTICHTFPIFRLTYPI